jgi:hypothetical protein
MFLSLLVVQDTEIMSLLLLRLFAGSSDILQLVDGLENRRLHERPRECAV